MLFFKDQLAVVLAGMFIIATLGGCGEDDEGSGSADSTKPDPGPHVTIEKYHTVEEEVVDRPAEEGWFQVRVKTERAPVDQDLIVRVRLLFTELNVSEKQVRDLKDDAFDEILWFRIPKLKKVSEPLWIRSGFTTAVQIVTLSRRHRFEWDTEAVDGSTIPEWWEPSPYQVAHPSVLIHHYD